MLVWPAATMYFLLKNKERLPERNMVARYSTMFDGIRTEHKSTVVYTGIFILRRLACVAIVVFLYEYEFAKVMGFVVIEIFYLEWTGWCRPHDDYWYNFLERLNEKGFLYISYIMFLQTNFIDD